MGIINSAAAQFAHPHGFGASLVAPVLNAVNRTTNFAGVEALDPASGDHVVDLGFGGGAAMRLLLRRLRTEGRVTGIDPSPEIRRRAVRVFRREIDAGLVSVAEGSAAAMPLDDSSVDGLLTVNTTYFWDDVLAGLIEIRRVLRDGGRMVIAMRPSAVRSHVRYYGPPEPLRPDEIARLCEQARFAGTELLEPARDTVIVTAQARGCACPEG